MCDQEKKDEMVAFYLSGRSLYSCFLKYDMSIVTIKKELSKRGIPVRSSREARNLVKQTNTFNKGV